MRRQTPRHLPSAGPPLASYRTVPAYLTLEEAIIAELLFLKAWEAGTIPGLFAMLRVRQIRRTHLMIKATRSLQ